MPPNSHSADTKPADVRFKAMDYKENDGSQTTAAAGGTSNRTTRNSNDFQSLPNNASLPTGTTTTKPSTVDDSISGPSLITLASIQCHTVPATHMNFKDTSINRERLFCSRCHKFMLQPLVIAECGHNICTCCKKDALRSGAEGMCTALDDGHSCDTHFNASQVRVDKGLVRNMKFTEIECPNKSEGCKETLLVSHIEEHLKDCVATRPKMPTPEDIQSDLLLRASESTQHNAASGISLLQFMSLVTCMKDFTTKMSLLETENTTLKQNQAELQAENTNLRSKVAILEFNMHKLTEEHKQLESKVKSVQQKATTTKSDTGTSGISVAAHGQMQGQLKKLGQQTTLHDMTLNELDLRIQCVESATYDGKMIWKISQFSEHLDRAKKGQTRSLFSQPFYAGNRGYKMCGRVYLNGDGSGKGTHISFFFVLMRGTYDDLLQWPFQQKITLGCKDVNNNSSSDIRESFNPSDKSQSVRKPISEMNVPSGCPQFVSHTNMNRYVKNDTIYLYLEIDSLGLEQMQQVKQVQLTTTRNTGTRK